MFRHHWLSFLTICSFLTLPLAAQAQDIPTTTTTTTTVERHMIITPAPQAVCTAVAAHWEGDIWVNTHNVCRYTDRSEGAAWIDAYWTCTQSDLDGNCTSWALVPGRWVNTLP
jgi:hypothetical protein